MLRGLIDNTVLPVHQPAIADIFTLTGVGFEFSLQVFKKTTIHNCIQLGNPWSSEVIW